MGRLFYKKRGKLYFKNSHRRSKSQELKRTSSEEKHLLECRQSRVKGTLQENINSLRRKMKHSNLMELPLQLRNCVTCTKWPKVLQKDAELFDILSKQLNIMQLYIKGKAFICENTTSDFQAIISFINNQARGQKESNDKVENTIGGCFAEVIEFMDSKRDRHTAIALMERLTSVNFVIGKLLHVQNKR